MFSVKLNKMIITLYSLFLMMLVVFGSAISAHALAGAYSSAELTNISYIINTVPYSISNESIGISTTPNAYAISPTGTNLSTDPYNFSTTTVSSDPTTIFQNSVVSANMSGTNTADASSFFDVFFDISVAGNVSASATYDLFLQVFSDTAAENAYGFSSASIYLFNTTQGTSNQSASQTISFDSLNIPTVNYLDILAGSLSTSLSFNAGDSGSIRFMVEGNATATSPVPEPSTFALFGIGLVGAALLKRRARN
ncbi:MAG: PEP-CTERM sorting domain-containing protein [Desulfuromonadaceae bacterium]|nr:PEP-CTERM sorting domain-containing protein [Desulfuromonadaceae bacterium]